MVLSRLDYCNSLLAGLPASAIRPLKLIQNAEAHLIFNIPRYTHTTPLLTDPPLAACHSSHQIQDIGACLPDSPRDQHPSIHLQQLIRPYTPARPLRPATSGRLVPPARHTCTSRSPTALLFWPHAMVEWPSCGRQNRPRRCPRSNADWKLISSDCISPSLIIS